MKLLEPRAMGTPLARLEGRAKVMGTAPYAYEHPVTHPLYLHPVQSTIARGRVEVIDSSAAEGLVGVVAVITHENAPRLASDEDKELWVLQSDEVHFRGQFVAAVIAESPEIARQAADLVCVEYATEPHDVDLRADRKDLYAPKQVNPFYPADTDEGDIEKALASAAVRVDQTYHTPMEHNNPMEMHSTVARWQEGALTLYDSTQGVHTVREAMAPLFGLDPRRVRVIAPYVGGGFGSKGAPHAHNVLAGLAAKVAAGRPAKLALTRQQMSRSPAIAHRRSSASGSAPIGRASSPPSPTTWSNRPHASRNSPSRRRWRRA
jgi:xanthine dehydrogenase YagR molybdenum-binding subunit